MQPQGSSAAAPMPGSIRTMVNFHLFLRQEAKLSI
jgi:hypothetical protein